MNDMRQCAQCAEHKPVSAFRGNRQKCRACAYHADRLRIEANYQEYLANGRAYQKKRYQANQDEMRTRRREHYWKTRDQQRAAKYAIRWRRRYQRQLVLQALLQVICARYAALRALCEEFRALQRQRAIVRDAYMRGLEKLRINQPEKYEAYIAMLRRKAQKRIKATSGMRGIIHE